MPRSSLLLTALLVACLASPAAAHNERPIESPPRPGAVPDLMRVNPTSIVVCKATSRPTKAERAEIEQRLATTTGDAHQQAERDLAAWQRNTDLFARCCFEHIQDAVNAAGDDTDILVMPGVYREEPSRAAPTSCNSCGDLENGTFSYEFQAAHPNDQNLIGIIGKKNVTLEGTGSRPEDVLIDVGFAKDVGVRCDRCEGFIVRNLWERDANEHGIYVVDSDGYIFDRAIGSYNKEYELFSFASDHGLYTDCEAYGGSDSGFYVGGDPVTPGRYATEMRRCKMHHNALGFSGTQGSYIWMHHNDVWDNAIGLSFDSETDHPNFPQRGSVIEDNLVHDNNFEIYEATSDVPPGGPGYDFFRYPVGTGIWIVGGDDNVVRRNWIYANKRMGMILARNPLEQPTPEQPQLSAVNRNAIYGNFVGVDVDGHAAPNLTAFPPGGDYAAGGSDFWWDETGDDNCWGPQDPASGPVKYDPPNALNPLPIPGPCPSTNLGNPAGNPQKLEILANCALDGGSPPHTNDVTYPCPWGQTNNAPYRNKDEAECGNGVIDLGEDCDPGYEYWPENLNGETCESRGHGGGTLACRSDCLFDTSACDIPGSCGGFGATQVKLARLTKPAGEQGLKLKAFSLSASGHPFDPTSEAVTIVIADQTGGVDTVTVPAGSAWRISTKNGVPIRYVYADRRGTNGGITKLALRAADPSGFGALFRVDVVMKHAPLAAAADVRAATARVRIGDDCWEDTIPCVLKGSGQTADCRSLQTCGS